MSYEETFSMPTAGQLLDAPPKKKQQQSLKKTKKRSGTDEPLEKRLRGTPEASIAFEDPCAEAWLIPMSLEPARRTETVADSSRVESSSSRPPPKKIVVNLNLPTMSELLEDLRKSYRQTLLSVLRLPNSMTDDELEHYRQTLEKTFQTLRKAKQTIATGLKMLKESRTCCTNSSDQ